MTWSSPLISVGCPVFNWLGDNVALLDNSAGVMPVLGAGTESKTALLSLAIGVFVVAVGPCSNTGAIPIPLDYQSRIIVSPFDIALLARFSRKVSAIWYLLKTVCCF